MERMWQMTRLGPGDYLLPSNDKSRLWRITRTDESDDAEGIGGWMLCRWNAGEGGHWLRATPAEVRSWSNWIVWDQGRPTRQSAINQALRVDAQVASR